MPKTAWTGYGRFCLLARALDVVGERWTLVIVQELMKRASRYSELLRRLPGIGNSVLADRLRTLETAGVVERRLGARGEGVVYALTERGLAVGQPLEALRRWGVTYLTDPTADGSDCQTFDVRYVKGIDALEDAEFGLVVDDVLTTLRFADGRLQHLPGEPERAELVVHTSSFFMKRWAAGDADWDEGVAAGDVTLSGDANHWPRWLAATGYLLTYEAPLATRGSRSSARAGEPRGS
jgi:DNA-binding HxlR family transcriptional regulator